MWARQRQTSACHCIFGRYLYYYISILSDYRVSSLSSLLYKLRVVVPTVDIQIHFYKQIHNIKWGILGAVDHQATTRQKGAIHSDTAPRRCWGHQVPESAQECRWEPHSLLQSWRGARWTIRGSPITHRSLSDTGLCLINSQYVLISIMQGTPTLELFILMRRTSSCWSG